MYQPDHSIALQSDSHGPSLHIADAWSVLLDRKLDVAALAPIRAPRVLHHPVVEPSRGIVSPASNQNGVICVDTTQGRVENARVVVHPGVVCGDRDGKGLDSESCLHLRDVVFGDVGPALGFDVRGITL